jgi:hypothetical protein
MSLLSEFFTKGELATELGRNQRTLDRWDLLRTGPPRTYVGRKVLYRRASVQKWLAAQEHAESNTRSRANLGT